MHVPKTPTKTPTKTRAENPPKMPTGVFSLKVSLESLYKVWTMGDSLGFYAPWVRQEGRAQRLTFWVRRPSGGVWVFHAKGWWPKSSCSPSKVCLPWDSKRGMRNVPGILPGCPGPLWVFKKFVPKKVRAHFPFPIECSGISKNVFVKGPHLSVTLALHRRRGFSGHQIYSE